jgi:hypothetical protein
MKNFGIILAILLIFGCTSERAPGCLQQSGEIISEEIVVADFEEIQVFDDVKLILEQGPQTKVQIKTGKNLLANISAEVIGNRLELRNESDCKLFREKDLVEVYVSTLNLTWLHNSSYKKIESRGTLKFPDLWLRSINQERDPEIYTNGDFELDLEVENLRITSDHISNFYLSGTVENFNLFIANGDARIEAGELQAQHIELLHRGSNKLILNPRQSISGDIYSFGDVIAKNRPAQVRVTEHYSGRLIFETP